MPIACKPTVTLQFAKTAPKHVQNTFLRTTANWIAYYGLPVNVANGHLFYNIFEESCGISFKKLSTDAVRDSIDMLYLHVVESIKSAIASAKSAASNEPFIIAQIDGWKTQSCKKLLGVGVSFYSPELKKVVYACLDCPELPEDETVVNHITLLKEVLDTYGISAKDVHQIASDNALDGLIHHSEDFDRNAWRGYSANLHLNIPHRGQEATLEGLTSLTHKFCFAHCLQLAISHAMPLEHYKNIYKYPGSESINCVGTWKEGKQMIKHMKEVVKYWRVPSNNRILAKMQEKRYDMMVDRGELKKQETGDLLYPRYTILKEDKKLRIKVPTTKTVQVVCMKKFCDTRWESVFICAKRMLRLYPILISLYPAGCNTNKPSNGFISPEMKTKLERVVALLQPFFHVTKQIQGEHYVHGSLKTYFRNVLENTLKRPGIKGVRIDGKFSHKMQTVERDEELDEFGRILKERLLHYLIYYQHGSRKSFNRDNPPIALECDLVGMALDPRLFDFGQATSLAPLKEQAMGALKTIYASYKEKTSAQVSSCADAAQPVAKKRRIDNSDEEDDEESDEEDELDCFALRPNNIAPEKDNLPVDELEQFWKNEKHVRSNDEPVFKYVQYDIWEWWERRKRLYPTLFAIAIRYLAPSGVSTFCERMFSFGGEISNGKTAAIGVKRLAKTAVIRNGIQFLDAGTRKRLNFNLPSMPIFSYDEEEDYIHE